MNLETLMELILTALGLFLALAAWAFVLSAATDWWDRRKERQRKASVHWLKTGRPL